jgi:hypothetical protein
LHERLHLKLAEEQHIKAIADQSANHAKPLQNQAAIIAAFTQIKEYIALNLDAIIRQLTTSAPEEAQNMISTYAQITKVQLLADHFDSK